MVLDLLDVYMQKNEDSYLLPCTILQSKCIKNLNIKQDTLNLTEQKEGNTLDLIVTGDKFLNKAPMVQVLRLPVDQWNFMELQSFFKGN